MISKKHKDLFDEIDLILWCDWDPIGVNDCNGARDEYTSYVPKILEFLLDNRDAYKISNHLKQLTTVSMCCASNPRKEKAVTELLLKAKQEHFRK